MILSYFVQGIEEALILKQQELEDVRQQLQQAQRDSEDTKLHLENLSSKTSTTEQGLQDKMERIAMLENANDQLENDNKELCQKVKFWSLKIMVTRYFVFSDRLLNDEMHHGICFSFRSLCENVKKSKTNFVLTDREFQVKKNLSI